MLKHTSLSTGVAIDILGTPLEKLEENTRKILITCRHDIEQAAEQKTTGKKFWTVCMLLAIAVQSNTQPNEGCNSLIKRICERCPRIGLPLLSTRTTTKRRLGVGVTGANTKWSHVREKARSLLQELVEVNVGMERPSRNDVGHIDDDDAYLEEFQQRWDIPLPTYPLPDGNRLGEAMRASDPLLIVTAAEEWASKKHTAWSKAFPSPSVDVCTVVGALVEGRIIHVCFDKSYSVGFCLALSVRVNEFDDTTFVAKIAFPLEPESSIHLLSPWYSHVEAGGEIRVSKHNLHWRCDDVDGLFALVPKGDGELVCMLKKAKAKAKAKPKPKPAVGPGHAPLAEEEEESSEAEEEAEDNNDDAVAEQVLMVAHLGLGDEGCDNFEDDVEQDALETEQEANKKREEVRLQKLMQKSEKLTKRMATRTATTTIEEETAADGGRDDVDDVALDFGLDILLADDVDIIDANEPPESVMEMATVYSNTDPVFVLWQHHAKQGASVLEERSVAVQLLPLGGRLGVSTLSLLAVAAGGSNCGCQDAFVTLVMWTRPGTKARRVRINYPRGWPEKAAPNKRPNLVWPTPGSFPENTFKDYEVIHPSLGTVDKKSTTVASELTLILKEMWEAAQLACEGRRAGEEAAASTSFEQCQWCKSEKICRGNLVPIKQCAFCLLAWHPSCSKLVSSLYAEHVLALPDGQASRVHLPQWWVDGQVLCALCSAWILGPQGLWIK